jgi:hypothetical protein
MKLKKTFFTTLLLTTLSISQSAKAEENLWIYTKGTDTRPQGSWELKLSDIYRTGKNSGHYRFHDIRPEIEYGITDRLTVGAELLIFDHHYSLGEEVNPMYETQGGENCVFEKTQLAGAEFGFKYNILSPYKDALGLSFGLAYERRGAYRLDGADIDQDAYVGTLFLQKNFLDDTLTLALNPKVELERRKSGDVLEEEIALDISAGVSYRVMPKHFVGLEFRHQSDYLNPSEAGVKEEGVQSSNWDLLDMQIGHQFQNGNYFGPTYHYAEKNWWITTGILFQFEGNGDPAPVSSDNKNWDEHEKYHIGLAYGYEF